MNELKQNNMQPYGDRNPGLWGYLSGVTPSIYYTIITEFENLKIKANQLGMKVKEAEGNVFGTAGLIKELRKAPQIAPYKFNLIVNDSIEETKLKDGKISSFIKVQVIEEL